MASQHHLEFDPVQGGLSASSPREATTRRAVARCRVMMAAETTDKVAQNANAKGDVLATARTAAIQAAKRTAELLPMCQMVMVGTTSVQFHFADNYIEVEVEVHTIDRTGVEMEAMTACTVAALTIYDMCKNGDRSMSIERVQLWEKSGGRSGAWRREIDLDLDEDL